MGKLCSAIMLDTVSYWNRFQVEEVSKQVSVNNDCLSAECCVQEQLVGVIRH